MTTRRILIALLCQSAVAAYFVLVVLHQEGRPQYDNYGQFLTYWIHAARSVRNGGKGLLWNPFSECGVPFFANGVVGLLYPPNLLFLVLEPNFAVHLILALEMVFGAFGMLLLARQWGLGWPAALGGALAFELGEPMAQFVGWNPTITAPLVWIPWALLLCERLLREPKRRDIVLLSVVLAIQVLPGNVLVNAFTYHILAFRVAWEVLRLWRRPPWRSVAAIAAAMLFGPCLAAIQLVPYVEWVQQSMRVSVEVDDRLKLASSFPLAFYVNSIVGRVSPVPFLAVPLVLAVIAPFVRKNRHIAVFWAALGVFYAVLALGHATPLFPLFMKLPPGGTVVHLAYRCFWVTGIAVSALVCFALEALSSPADRASRRWTPVLVIALLGVVFHLSIPKGLRWQEVVALALVVVAFAVAAVRATPTRRTVWLVAAALLLDLGALSVRWGGVLISDLSAYRVHAPALEKLASESMTVQDRVVIWPSLLSTLDLTLMYRTGTVLGLRDFSDYAVLPGRRWNGYWLMLSTRKHYESYRDLLPSVVARGEGLWPRLLDAAAIKFVVAPAKGDPVAVNLDLPRVAVDDAGLHVYRNDKALGRARFVPNVEVVSDPEALLTRLAIGDDDLAVTALVEEAPASGFTGTMTEAALGTADFLVDDPENIVIDVEAPQRGFLVLSDRFYPGWRARVNDVPATIQRANYMFRLVEVPAGKSRVQFTFFPTHFALGAAISALAAAALIALLLGGRRARSGAVRDSQGMGAGQENAP